MFRLVSSAVVVLAVIVGAVVAEEPAAPAPAPAPREICEKVMAHVANNEVAAAVDVLGAHLVRPVDDVRRAVWRQELQTQLQEAEHRSGRSLGYALLSEKPVGDTFFLCRYVLKYERHYLCWQFRFYRPEEKWLLYNFQWSDALDAPFREWPPQ